MTSAQERLYQAALWSMLVSAAAIIVSIAVSQIFLGLALIALIGSEAPLRFPPIKAPLFLLLGWTLLSLLASGHIREGLPQVRKFFVYVGVLLVAYTVFGLARQARWLAGAWFLLAAASALRSLVQFTQKLDEARVRGEDFYQFYVGERITGFLSHWMTFGEVSVLVLLVLLSYLFFSPAPSRRSVVLCCLSGAVLLASLLVSFTRSIWLALAVAGGYLVWQWRKKLLWLAPLLVAVAFAAGPGAFQRRIESMFRPSSDSSINARRIMWRTGWRMIRTHPLLGVGPQQVGPQFRSFLPADVGPLPPAYYEHLHNLYIHFAAERGVPAALAVLWLLARIVWDHRRALGRSPAAADRFLLHAAIAVTLAIAVGGLFEVNLGDSEVLTVFLTAISLGYAAIGRGRPPQPA